MFRKVNKAITRGPQGWSQEEVSVSPWPPRRENSYRNPYIAVTFREGPNRRQAQPAFSHGKEKVGGLNTHT